jgi:hypothetical protein
MSNNEAFVVAYSGHLRQARDLSSRVIDEAKQAAQRERAAVWEAVF